MIAKQKIKELWQVKSADPLPTLLLSGSVCLLGFTLFALVAFFIPNTDRTFFPPYLALPESGFELSNYYILYTIICLNALILFGFYLLALRAVGAGDSADAISAGSVAGEFDDLISAGGTAGEFDDLKSAGGVAGDRNDRAGLADDSAGDQRPGIWSNRTNRIIFGFAVLFHLLMFITPFLLSTDVFDYIRHGRIFAFYGENPLLVPATYFPQDPFFSMGGWVGTGSVYGSLHVYITALLARIAGDGIAANLLIFRGFFISLNLVNLVLIWKIAARIKPGLERRALVFYGWNPFILTLVVANAHNDILMLALVLAGLLCYLDRRYLIGVVGFTLATLVKFVTLPMLLIYVALVIRKHRGRLRQIAFAAGSLSLAVSITALSYLPLWEGRDTFLYLFTIGQKTNNTISALARDAAAGHLQLSVSNIIVQGMLAAILVAYLVWHLIGVRDFRGLISASAGMALLTPLALFWFQPWYLTLGLGLVALRPWRYMYIAALAFSFSVMFFDSFWWHTPVSMEVQKPLRVLVVFGPPIVLLAILKARESGPKAWRRLVDWSFAGPSSALPKSSGVPALSAGGVNLQNDDARAIARLTDPSPLRLMAEISVLLIAAVVPMAVVISTSPQLKSLASLIAVKIRLLVNV